MKKGKIELRHRKVGSQKIEIRCRKFKADFQMVDVKKWRRYKQMRETREKVEKIERESLAAVHTHTHTHTQVVLMNK